MPDEETPTEPVDDESPENELTPNSRGTVWATPIEKTTQPRPGQRYMTSNQVTVRVIVVVISMVIGWNILVGIVHELQNPRPAEDTSVSQPPRKPKLSLDEQRNRATDFIDYYVGKNYKVTWENELGATPRETYTQGLVATHQDAPSTELRLDASLQGDVETLIAQATGQ